MQHIKHVRQLLEVDVVDLMLQSIATACNSESLLLFISSLDPRHTPPPLEPSPPPPPLKPSPPPPPPKPSPPPPPKARRAKSPSRTPPYRAASLHNTIKADFARPNPMVIEAIRHMPTRWPDPPNDYKRQERLFMANTEFREYYDLTKAQDRGLKCFDVLILVAGNRDILRPRAFHGQLSWHEKLIQPELYAMLLAFYDRHKDTLEAEPFVLTDEMRDDMHKMTHSDLVNQLRNDHGHMLGIYHHTKSKLKELVDPAASDYFDNALPYQSFLALGGLTGFFVWCLSRCKDAQNMRAERMLLSLLRTSTGVKGAEGRLTRWE